MSERPENYEEELQRLDDKQKLSPMRFQFDRERILTIFADNDEDGYRELFGSNWSNLDFRGLLSELKTKQKQRIEKRERIRESTRKSLAGQLSFW